MVTCALLLYFLIPNDPGLLEDLVQDGKAKEARRVLRKVSGEDRAKEGLRYEIAEQKIERIELAEAGESADWDAYFLNAIARWQQQFYAASLFDLWVDELPRARDVDALWSVLEGNWSAVTLPQRERLLKNLVPLALGQERPDLAAEIFAATAGDRPKSEAQALELVRLRRLAGDAAGALRALGDIASDKVDAVRVSLLRELNRNDVALENLLAKLSTRSDYTGEEIALLVAVARGAGQPGRAVPFVEKQVQSHKNDIETWRYLVRLQRESGAAPAAAASQGRVVELSDRDPVELREWGRLLEGAGKPGQAFDVWYELGMQRDQYALDRLIALNPGLYRNKELAEVLETVVPVDNHDDYTLTLARLLTEQGRYEDATKAYDQYIEAVPTDLGAMIEVATLEIELFRYDEASKWLERVKVSGLRDVATRRKLADAWTGMGEFELAMEEYRSVAEETRDTDDFGNYIRLARGIGAYEDFVAGLISVVESDQAEVSDFLTLAYGYQLLGQDELAKKTLRDGIDRFPKNTEMPMRLAYAYSDAKRYREAQEAVRLHPDLGQAVEPTRLYLILMRLNNDTAQEREFLKREFPPQVWADPESKQMLARANLALGNLPVAERLLRELHREVPEDWDVTADLVLVLQQTGKIKEAKALLVPLLASDSAEALKLAAEVSAALGEWGEAERLQLRYLAKVSPGVATDWGALGDIRLSRGDRRGAKQAYRRALREFQLDLLADGSSGP